MTIVFFQYVSALFLLASICSVVSGCVVVYIVDIPGAVVVSEGTSIRYDGTYKTPYTIDINVLNATESVFDCVTIKSIDTDNELGLQKQINRWIDRDCSLNKCYVVSKLGSGYSQTTSSDVYSFRRTRVHVLKKKIALTPPPTIPHQCELRSEYDCHTGCHYFGLVYGCRTKDFCEFKTKYACETQLHCIFHRKCLTRNL
jgi:hypothetical protein